MNDSHQPGSFSFTACMRRATNPPMMRPATAPSAPAITSGSCVKARIRAPAIATTWNSCSGFSIAYSASFTPNCARPSAALGASSVTIFSPMRWPRITTKSRTRSMPSVPPSPACAQASLTASEKRSLKSMTAGMTCPPRKSMTFCWTPRLKASIFIAGESSSLSTTLSAAPATSSKPPAAAALAGSSAYRASACVLARSPKRTWAAVSRVVASSVPRRASMVSCSAEVASSPPARMRRPMSSPDSPIDVNASLTCLPPARAISEKMPIASAIASESRAPA